ncbi:MAG: hypothetical protein D3923_11675 [Candidatus Electrothrix sp. AR3]|nr:hypothetical protein [Candidatus Electrothrix sp. AR3]
MIEFLYGSHGKITYIIDPQASTITRIEKLNQQPWHWLNRLHKAYKTNTFWIILTDSIALLIMVLTFSGLVIFRYKRQDIILLLLGILCLIIGMASA